MYYDNQITIRITKNFIFHERTTHVMVRQKVASRLNICHQLINWQIYLWSLLEKPELDFICDKLGMFDINTPAWERVKLWIIM